MSAADFQNAFQEYLAKVGTYNAAQRGTLLNAFKEATAETLSAIGAPLPEGAAAPAAEKSAEPAKAAAAEATPAKAAASSVTGAKPSSRVNQNPGGNSSLNLGAGGDDRPVSHHGRKQLQNTNQSSIQFGASDDSAKTSVRVAQAPGGGSSIQFGDDSTPAGAMASRGDDSAAGKPKKGGRKLLQAAGGQTHDVFNQKDNANAGAAHTSIKTNQAPGGGSSLSLAHDSKPEGKENGGGSAAAAAAANAAAASGDVPPALLKEIIAAVYRKGKVKDTFTKFTGNKGKALSIAELKDGVVSLGVATFSDAQSATLMSRFTADAKAGMTFPEFMKMMSA